VGDQLADERSESCQLLFPIAVCSDGRTKRSRRLTVVRETGAHLFIVTPTTGDGQGQRSRLGIDIMEMTATGRSARSRPGSMPWKGRTTLVLSIGSQHHGECGVSPLFEWSTGERRRLVPLAKRLPMPGPTDHARGDLPRTGDLGRPPVPSAYPVGLECEIVTRAGTPMTMRPIIADDSLKLSDFHGLLSPTSVYRRYFYLHPELSPKEIVHLTEVDYVARLAMVVEHDGQLVAVGRYDRYPGTSEAEVAFVVADDYQHLGLGTLLLEHLARAARRTGISVFEASVLVENRGMLDVFRNSGYPLVTTSATGIVSARMSIGPDERPVVMAEGSLDSPIPL
jgi:GNAT superfamily N-acetyltransferase